MLSHKILNPTVTELFIRGRKLNISLVFITQFYFAKPKNIKSVWKFKYFAVPKNIRLNSTRFIMNIQIKQKLQQIAFNHLHNIEFNGPL